jgi:hypothetical protein
MPTQFSLKINGSCPDKASDMRELHAPMREFHACFIFPEAAPNFLKDQVMRLSKGKANPNLVGEILERKLKG